jgi:hypothetical protein
VGEVIGAAEGADWEEGETHRPGHDAVGHHHVGVLVGFDAALADRLLDGGAEEEEADIKLGDATTADEEGGGDPGELGAQPQVRLLLADHLSDEGGGAALEVVALIEEVVAVLDELLHGVLFGHELGNEGAVLVVADPLTEAVGVYLEVFAPPFGKDIDSGHGATPSCVARHQLSGV